MLWDYQIVDAADLADIWRFRGGLVTSGMFAVGKAKKKFVVRRDGSKGKRQRCIINLIPPKSLRSDIGLGENDLLPAGAFVKSAYLLPLQMLLMSARDRRCFFYVFSMPKGWSGVFALCVQVAWTDFGVDRLGHTLIGVRVCFVG